MTLEEAIRHAEEVAEREYKNAQVYDEVKKDNLYHPDRITCEQAAKSCRECAAEHRQLAEWLTELKHRREADVPDMDGGNMECGDCVNRKAAKEIIFSEFEGWPTEEEIAQMKRLIKQINDLPPVIFVRPRGKWIQLSPAKIYECSCCGQNVMTSDIGCYQYCHGCGARMEVEG